LTRLEYEKLLPMTGWQICRKKKNSVTGIVAYDAKDQSIFVITDRGLLVSVKGLQSKGPSSSFAIECDVVVDTK
jgi:hypothetical protein